MNARSTPIAITMGDVCGIGPEVTMAALADLPATTRDRCVVFGIRSVLADYDSGLAQRISVVEPANLTARGQPGHPTLDSAGAQISFLESAAAAGLRGDVGAIVTAPISKTWATRRGFEFPGHTQFFAHRFSAPRYAMMFAGPKLRIALVTTHVSLQRVSSSLSIESVADVIELVHQSMERDFGVERPRIGILGLNPHAGEEGLFGDEEQTIIGPAIRRCQEKLGANADLCGPLVPDAAFRSRRDVFVAMYHDQGLIPAKLVDFEESVNMTLGLPIVRTSPDHGVAYDIAGKGIARSTSMRCAIELAAAVLERRQRAPR